MSNSREIIYVHVYEYSTLAVVLVLTSALALDQIVSESAKDFIHATASEDAIVCSRRQQAQIGTAL